MSRLRKNTWATMVMGIGGWIALAATAVGADRPVAQILKDLDAVKVPKLDSRLMQNRSYMHTYASQRREAWDKRDLLIFELYKAAPKNERIPELMAERWGRKDDHSRGLIKEIDDVLAHNKDPKLKADGTFIKRGSTKSKKAPQEHLRIRSAEVMAVGRARVFLDGGDQVVDLGRCAPPGTRRRTGGRRPARRRGQLGGRGEVDHDEWFLADHPRVVARGVVVGVARAEFRLGTVVHSHPQPSRDHDGGVRELARAAADDRLHVGGPAPAGAEYRPPDSGAADVHHEQLAVLETPLVLGRA